MEILIVNFLNHAHELIKDTPKTPHIGSLVILLFYNLDFRSSILPGANSRGEASLLSHLFLLDLLDFLRYKGLYLFLVHFFLEILLVNRISDSFRISTSLTNAAAGKTSRML
jgi:hypothetical protein